MRKALCINYYFPPIPSIGCIRNYSIAKSLTKDFIDVHIVTSNHINDYSDTPFDLNIFSAIYTVPVFDYRTLVKGKKGVKEFHVSGNIRNNKNYIHKILNTSIIRFLIGEGGLIYIISSYLKSKQIIRNQGITHVISSYRPFADHYVAYLLKKRFPDLIWLADFRDPPFQKNEQNTIKKADYYSCASQGIVEYLNNKCEKKTLKLPNAITQAQLEFLSALTYASSKKTFTIVYTGSLYPLKQPIAAFLQTLKSWISISKNHDIKLVYAGKDGDLWGSYVRKAGLEYISHNYGVTSQEDSWRLQYFANCNIIFSWNLEENGGILTGKLFEYLAARNPILVCINGTKDPEWEALALEHSELFVHYFEKEVDNMIHQYLDRLYNEWYRGNAIRLSESSRTWANNRTTLMKFLTDN